MRSRPDRRRECPHRSIRKKLRGIYEQHNIRTDFCRRCDRTSCVFSSCLTVRACNAGNHEIAVYIHTAADRENDFQSPHSNPPREYLRSQALTGCPAKTSNVFSQISLQATVPEDTCPTLWCIQGHPATYNMAGLRSARTTYLHVLCSIPATLNNSIHYFDGTALGFIPRWCRKGMVII